MLPRAANGSRRRWTTGPRCAACSSSPSTATPSATSTSSSARASRAPTAPTSASPRSTAAWTDEGREEIKRRFNAEPDEASPPHPGRDRRRARGRQPPEPLRRPLPLRRPVEPEPHGAAQRAHRPQGPAREGGALPLLRLRPAAGGPGARHLGEEDAQHPGRTREPLASARGAPRARHGGRHPQARG